jgi:hypothetical protein
MSRSSLFCHNPKPRKKGWIMAGMLTMAAVEVGNPMLFVILMKSDNCAVHYGLVLTIDRLIGCIQYQLIKGQIQPIPKFKSRLLDCACMVKAEGLMEGNAG